jgi:hypothetical protein
MTGSAAHWDECFRRRTIALLGGSSDTGLSARPTSTVVRIDFNWNWRRCRDDATSFSRSSGVDGEMVQRQ